MKATNKTIFTLIVGCIAASSLLMGCVKQKDIFVGDVLECTNETAGAQVFGDSIVLGERLNNPYSMQNMQAAYNQVMATRGDTIDEVTLL